MGELLKRHTYIIIWILSLLIIGALAIVVLQLNSYIPTPLSPATQSGGQHTTIPTPTHITLTIVKSRTGNSLFVQWQNLPDGTAALNIYRGKTGTDPSTWLLWKTLSLTGYDLMSGNSKINIGTATEIGYSYSVQAVGNIPGNGTGSGQSQVILWQSSSTTPYVATTPPTQSESTPINTSLAAQTNSSSTSSTTQQISQTSSSTGLSTNNSPTAPSGTPYYNPQIQIESYGSSQSGTFWVKHLDQKIEIGWQNLPSQTTSIVISRSQNQTGSWTDVLTLQNPGTAGSYSIQVVDNTLSAAYYYAMTAYAGTATVATYGPIYLAAQ